MLLIDINHGYKLPLYKTKRLVIQMGNIVYPGDEMGIQLTCKLQVTVNAAYSDRIRVTNIFCLNVKLLYLVF